MGDCGFGWSVIVVAGLCNCRPDSNGKDETA